MQLRALLPWLALVPFVAWLVWSCFADAIGMENNQLAFFAAIGQFASVVITIGCLVALLVWGLSRIVP